MPSYTVVLNDQNKTQIHITADDFKLDGVNYEDSDGNQQVADKFVYFQFLRKERNDDFITVAAVPYNNVLHITS